MVSKQVGTKGSRDTYPVPLTVHQGLGLLEDLGVDVGLGQARGEGGGFGMDLWVGWVSQLAWARIGAMRQRAPF